MNKNVFLLGLLLVSLFGCSLQKEYVADLNNTIVMKGNLKIEVLDFKVKNPTSYEKRYETSFYLSFLSKDPKQVSLSANKAKVYKESNNAEYSIASTLTLLTSYGQEPKLSCDIEYKTMFTSFLPSNPEEEKYFFKIQINGFYYRLNFYKLSDNNKKYTLTYFIDEDFVEEKKVSAYKKINNYNWLSDDLIYGCNDFYYDKKYITKVGPEDIIISNLNLYGKKQTILEYHDPGYSSLFVRKINFIPHTKEIMIPGTFNGRKIYGVLAGSFYGDNLKIKDLEKIYISKNINSFSNVSTFEQAVNLKEIHFEGNQSQWDSIYEGTLPIGVDLFFNSYK